MLLAGEQVGQVGGEGGVSGGAARGMPVRARRPIEALQPHHPLAAATRPATR